MIVVKVFFAFSRKEISSKVALSILWNCCSKYWTTPSSDKEELDSVGGLEVEKGVGIGIVGTGVTVGVAVGTLLEGIGSKVGSKIDASAVGTGEEVTFVPLSDSWEFFWLLKEKLGAFQKITRTSPIIIIVPKIPINK